MQVKPSIRHVTVVERLAAAKIKTQPPEAAAGRVDAQNNQPAALQLRRHIRQRGRIKIALLNVASRPDGPIVKNGQLKAPSR